MERSAQSLRIRASRATVHVVSDAAAFRGICASPIVGAEDSGSRRRPRATNVTDAFEGHALAVRAHLQVAAIAGRGTVDVDRPPHRLAAVESVRAESGACVARDVLQAGDSSVPPGIAGSRSARCFPGSAEFALVSAVEVSPGVFYGTENIAALHRRAVEELSSGYGIAPGHADVRAGQPAAVIGQIMKEHDVRLVVLGLSRHSLLQQVVLGSITQTVTLDSPCDVLLIPQPPPGAGRK